MMKILPFFAVIYLTFALIHAKDKEEKWSLKSAIRGWFKDTELPETEKKTDADDVPVNNDLVDDGPVAVEVDKRTNSAAAKDSVCQYGIKQNAPITDYGTTIPFDFNSAINDYYTLSCGPRPVVVRINTPGHITALPQYMKIHRCMGITTTVTQRCVATQLARIYVTYIDTETYNQHNATMYNHTACGQECITQASECNANQTYEHCQCTCNLNSASCNSTWQHFDPGKCRCNCLNVQNCALYREWDDETCTCKCAKCLKELCLKDDKSLDEETCSCS